MLHMKYTTLFLASLAMLSGSLIAEEPPQKYEITVQLKVAGTITEEFMTFVDSIIDEDDEQITDMEQLKKLIAAAPQLQALFEDTIQSGEVKVRYKFFIPGEKGAKIVNFKIACSCEDDDTENDC